MSKELKKLYKELSKKYWGGELPLIDVEYRTDLDCLGEYFYPENEFDSMTECRIVIEEGLSGKNLIDTMLHEMAHHYVFINNKELVWNKKIYMHGRLWRQEMRRIGFKGRITRYT